MVDIQAIVNEINAENKTLHLELNDKNGREVITLKNDIGLNLMFYVDELLETAKTKDELLKYMLSAGNNAIVSLSNSWDEIKTELFFTVGNIKQLDNFDDWYIKVPYSDVVGYVVMPIHLSAKMFTIAKVSKEMCEVWGKTPEEVTAAAIKNMRGTHCLKSVFDLDGEISLDEPFAPEEHNMYIVTNHDMSFGANVLFDTEFLQQISLMFGADLLLLPSSRHEMIVMRRDGTQDEEFLKEMVVTINETEIEPADFLSNHIFTYNGMLDTVSGID